MKKIFLFSFFAAFFLIACYHYIPMTGTQEQTITIRNHTTTLVTSIPSVITKPTFLSTSASSCAPAAPWEEYAVVSFVPEVENTDKTYTGLLALPAVEYLIKDPQNKFGLSDKRIDFSFGVASDGKPHEQTVANQQQFEAWSTGALAWDGISEDKVLYLTFDCGYEYENITAQVLDILSKKRIQSAFFCTMTYLRSRPDVVARMILDGHTVGNHSLSHPENCAALTREALAEQALAVENYLRVNFGYSTKYFRFPAGVYSENAVQVLSSVGYRSVFWSIAYADWDPVNQVGPEKAFEILTSRLHPGAVILLHTTSPDNLNILEAFIDYALAQGYRFAELNDYPGWK